MLFYFGLFIASVWKYLILRLCSLILVWWEYSEMQDSVLMMAKLWINNSELHTLKGQVDGLWIQAQRSYFSLDVPFGTVHQINMWINLSFQNDSLFCFALLCFQKWDQRGGVERTAGRVHALTDAYLLSDDRSRWPPSSVTGLLSKPLFIFLRHQTNLVPCKVTVLLDPDTAG